VVETFAPVTGVQHQSAHPHLLRGRSLPFR
jgi:hypothetical protein